LKIERTLTSYVLVDSNMRILPEVLDFTNTLEKKGLSPNTIKAYLDDLKLYYIWLEQNELKFYSVHPSELLGFLEFLDQRKGKKISPPTWNRYLATLGSFYRHLEVIGGHIESPVVTVESNNNRNYGFLKHITPKWGSFQSYFKRKEPKKTDKKRLYDDNALRYYEALETLFGDNEDLLIRNKLIFKILYETGFRTSELLHLRMDDYDYPDPEKKTGNLYLIERPDELPDRELKTGERTVPVASELLQEIDDYVLYHRPSVPGVEYLIVSHSTNSLGQPISRQSIISFFAKLDAAVDIKGVKLTAHSLRHTHASELQDMGVDVNVIKERIGHRSIETTAKYAKPSLKTLSLSYERFLNARGQK
jgi:integrase/recombinase XerD